jgi:signal transduction histidine kinase
MRIAGLRPLPAGLLALAVVFAVASFPLSAGLEGLWDTVLYPINAVVLALAGALIVSRQRAHPIGWILLGLGVEAAFVELSEGYGYHAAYAGSVVSEWLSSWGSILGASMTAVVLALFPTGRAASRRWRPVVWAAIAGTVLTVAGTAFGHSADDGFRSGSNPYALDGPLIPGVYLAGQALFGAALLGAIASLVVRFRRSTGIERQQLKWVAYVVCALAVVGPLAIFFYFDSVAVQIAIAVVVTALPVAICVAILRYRLYDIDIIINRTLVYGVMTLLVASYLVTALALGAIVGTRHSAWVTAGATLAAVGVFRPLRRRIQDAVDRRFRKARYDALTRVANFLEELRAGRTAPDGLGPLLRDVLSLPDLQLYYAWPDEAGGHIDDQGVFVTLDRADGRTYSTIERAGTPLAVVAYTPLDHRRAPRNDHTAQMVGEVLDRAGLAIEIARLQAEVRHQLAEVQASRARIVAAGYAERRRLERDLHDGAQQRLVSIGLALRHAQHQLGPSDVSRTIEEAVGQISGAIADLRELANGVRPANLDNGLGFALRELAHRTPVPIEVCADDERFPTDVEATAYFVACEAVTNAVKHATAGRLLVQTERVNEHLVVTIQDDGVGGAQPANGSGLRGLSDRVAALGGRMRLESPSGSGTTLIAELPCAS